MATIACSGCGVPRADELIGTPCPICSQSPSVETAPPPPVVIPLPPEPTVEPRSNKSVYTAFTLGLLLGALIVSLILNFRTKLPEIVKVEVPSPPVRVTVPVTVPTKVDTPTTTTSTKVAETAKKLDHPKSIDSRAAKLTMLLIPAGEFEMGSWDRDESYRPDEYQHRVKISKPFYMGVTEVTQEEYARVTGERPSAYGGDSGKYAVESVTWFDAIAFCNTLSERDALPPYYEIEGIERAKNSITAAKVKIRGGSGYRLPTEAEWEYACRAGTRSRFHYGGETEIRDANVKPPMVAGGYGGSYPKWKAVDRVAEVGTYPVNKFGLYDMHGNVAEWCYDWYDENYYRTSPESDPQGPEKAHVRVVRGGCWMLPDARARSAARMYATPDERKNYLGFRIAKDP